MAHSHDRGAPAPPRDYERLAIELCYAACFGQHYCSEISNLLYILSNSARMKFTDSSAPGATVPATYAESNEQDPADCDTSSCHCPPQVIVGPRKYIFVHQGIQGWLKKKSCITAVILINFRLALANSFFGCIKQGGLLFSYCILGSTD
jgi:hypothetical protein